jgi:proline iminopeptidase
LHKTITMKNTVFLLFLSMGLLAACTTPTSESDNTGDDSTASAYFDNTGRDDVLSGGVKMIPITTPKGTFNVWTKRTGNNPKIKLLLLHGGPGATHEYFECFDSFLPAEGIEYYYYDQLGSFYSDKPGDPELWTIEHFVEEVEQVRKALGLSKDNFFLLGHSWGGILGIEYAMKYQENLKGLIVSNMMSSIPEYAKYAKEVLGPQMDAEVLKEIMALEEAKDFDNPRYTELVTANYYPEHVLRMPLDQWPDPANRGFAHMNYPLYVHMQGYSEFGVTEGASLEKWDRSGDLSEITVPTLTIGGAYDTMDPKHMEWMAGEFPNGEYLHCPNGSHMAMYDDQKTYVEGCSSVHERSGVEGKGKGRRSKVEGRGSNSDSKRLEKQEDY